MARTACNANQIVHHYVIIAAHVGYKSIALQLFSPNLTHFTLQ